MLFLPNHWIRLPAVFVAVVLLIGAGTGTGLTTPSFNNTERNGLTSAERATLFSRDVDSEALPNARARDSQVIQVLANETDITFRRASATAATWSRNDFRNFEPGGTETSIHPPGAGLEDGRFIRDATTSIFGIHPATQAHLSTRQKPLYVAPNATVRATVDYRIRTPENDTNGDDGRRVYWSIESHEIKTVRLRSEGTVLDAANRTHSPTLEFDQLTPGNRTLTVESSINVTMQKEVKQRLFREDDLECERDEDNSQDGDDDDDGDVDEGGECYYWSSDYRYPSEEVGVNESIDVTIYGVDPTKNRTVQYARFPDGSVEMVVSADHPWAGFSVGEVNVTGIWRFYTARDTRWDFLVASSASGDRRLRSDVIPVFVHAYPSQTGVQVRPFRGPEFITVSGERTTSPQTTLGDNISVDVVTRRYRRSDSILIRIPNHLFTPESIRVSGVVRGESVTPAESDIGKRELRRSDLQVEMLQSNDSEATLRLSLQDNRTGRPIVLREDQRPRDESGRDGYITVAGRRVETNRSGVALVTVDRPGVYTARYHPESWVRIEPAYTSDTATARWHPLTTIDGWFRLFIQVARMSIPFVVAYYAGTRLLVLLGRRNP